MNRPLIDLVSFGVEYDRDIHVHWASVAADKCGIDLTVHPDGFLGMRQKDIGAWGYHNFFDRITRRIYKWDICQIEDHALYMPETLGLTNVFAEFPRRIINGLPCYWQNPRGIPAAQGCYMVGWRKDKHPQGFAPTWEDFFDIERIPGKRAIREFPTSNIEMALLSLGRDVDKVLYDERLSKEVIEKQVMDALNRLGSIRDHTLWWSQGYDSVTQLMKGDVVLGGIWNYNVIKANLELCPGAAPQDWIVQANPGTAIIIVDWFVVIQGTGNEEAANKLLECMYNDKDALKGAAKYCALQGTPPPVEGIEIRDPFQRYGAELGLWKNKEAPVFMNTRFWGRNFDWICEMWKTWRVEFGGADPNKFFQSPIPPFKKEVRELREKAADVV